MLDYGKVVLFPDDFHTQRFENCNIYIDILGFHTFIRVRNGFVRCYLHVICRCQ